MKEANAKLNRFIPIFLTLFAILSVLPMIYYPDPTLYGWINSAAVKDYYWISEAGIFMVFALVVWAKNRAEPPLRYGLMFLWVMLFSIVLVFVHECSLTYGHNEVYTLPLSAVALYEAKTFYDVFFCFAVLFLWPYAKKEPRYKNALPIVVVLFALVSVVYAFIRGRDASYSYVYYTSFFKTNEDLGKVLFAGCFALGVLAYDAKRWLRYALIFLDIGLLVATGLLGLSITFWCLTGASVVIAFTLLSAQKDHLLSKPLKWGSLLYFFLVLLLVLLTSIPSSLASTLRSYLGEEFIAVFSSRLKVWKAYLDSISSWRIFVGDGLMGYYRSSLLATGQAVFTPLENGILEVYNSGGLVYLLFYFLAIVIGLAKLKKEEAHHPIFYAVIVAFTGAFLFFTTLTDERLFFSSNFLSFVVAYLFMGYSHHKTIEDEE